MDGKRLRWSPPRLRPSDLILLPLRPPLDDDDEETRPKRRTLKSGYEIEGQMFTSLRSVIGRCDRERLLLNIPLPEAARRYEEVYYKLSKGARVKSLGPRNKRPRPPADPRLTVAYVISIPHVPPVGFRLLAAFGIGGSEGLIFAQMLRTHWGELIPDFLRSARTRVAIATFLVPDWMPYPILEYDPLELDARIVADVEPGGDEAIAV